MMDPMSFLDPQKRQQLQQLKVVGKRIKAEIHKHRDRAEIRLTAGDPEAEQYLPAFTESLCQSMGQTLHMFDITGEIVDHGD